MLKVAVRTVATVAFLVGGTVHAQLATFDDLASCVPSNAHGVLVDPGYKGFSWSNFYVVDGAAAAAAAAGPGYGNGVVSPSCIALNGFGANATISSASDFIFNGGFFTAAFTPGLSLSVTAFNAANVQIFNSAFSLQTTIPTLMNVNWAGVRSVTFASGTNTAGSQFAFDNFRFNNTSDPHIPPTTTPEPATVAMMGAGLAVVLLATRRRRS